MSLRRLRSRPHYTSNVAVRSGSAGSCKFYPRSRAPAWESLLRRSASFRQADRGVAKRRRASRSGVPTRERRNKESVGASEMLNGARTTYRSVTFIGRDVAHDHFRNRLPENRTHQSAETRNLNFFRRTPYRIWRRCVKHPDARSNGTSSPPRPRGTVDRR
jgi:hypothetical protein